MTSRKLIAHKIGLCVLSLCISSPVLADINQTVTQLVTKLTTTLEGKVIKAMASTLYISLGRQQGVVKGLLFEIIRRGEPLKLDGKVVGYEEAVIGEAQVELVQDAVSKVTITGKPSQPPKAGDKVSQKRKSLNRLVVAPFSYNQGITEFSQTLQQKLITTLVQKGIQVVERSQLEQVLKEQKLTYSGLFNLSSAKQVGQLLGAEGIVLGTIADQGNSVSINARIVDLGSANTITAVEVETAKTPTIAQALQQIVETGNGFSTASGTGDGSANTTKKGRTVVVDDVLVEVAGCKRSSGVVVCTTYITNQGDDRRFIVYGKYGQGTTTSHDDLRDSHSAKQVKVADQKKSRVQIYAFDGGVPVRANFYFDDISPKAKRLTLLNIKLCTDIKRNGRCAMRKPNSIKFKNVKIR